MVQTASSFHELKISQICASFVRSAICIGAISVAYVFFTMAANDLIVDFINNNPNRTRLNAAETPILFSIYGLFFIFYLLSITSAVPLLGQAILIRNIARRSRPRVWYAALIVLLPLAVVSWYGYEYLSLDLGTGADEDWRPFVHGITPMRYLVMLVIQTSISLLCISRFIWELQGRSKIKIIVTLVLIAIVSVAGIVNGISNAQVVQIPKNGRQ